MARVMDVRPDENKFKKFNTQMEVDNKKPVNI